MIEKICLCGHLEREHKYLDKTKEQLIQSFINNRRITPRHDPDLIQAVGYTTKDGQFYKFDTVMEMLDNLRNEQSYCVAGLISHNCTCKAFRADNLKYLEICCERKAS